ncbi:MAG: zinc-ribbon domain-containing protein, partial [Promethearchaeota archaeon]
NLAEALGADIDHFKCKVCGADVSLSNLTCPNCGQLYCQYCGAPLDMENPGVCPRCGGIPYYQPAELVITRVEDLPPEERFWEELPTCPKCGATVQPDWDSCPICGAKLSPSKKPTGDQIDTGVWTEEELEKVQPKQPEKLESAKAVKRRMRKEKGKKGKSGI